MQELTMIASPVNEGPVVLSQLAREDQGGLKIIVKFQLLVKPFDDIRHPVPPFLHQLLVSLAGSG